MEFDLTQRGAITASSNFHMHKILLLAITPFLCTAGVNAAETSQPTAPAAADKSIPKEYQGDWVVDIEASIAAIKASPKWTADDESMLPMVRSHYGTLRFIITDTEIRAGESPKSPSFVAAVKAREGDTLVIECTPPAGKPGSKPLLRASFPQKDRMNLMSPGERSMEFIRLMKKPEGWKPVTKGEVAGKVLSAAVSSTAAKPVKTGPTQANAQNAPAWEKDRWSKSQAAYRINDTMTQADFATFCREHADAEAIEIDRAKGISDLAPLAGLGKIKSLTLRNLTEFKGGNKIDLTPLSTLTALESIDCYATRVSHTEAIKGLSKLKTVSFYMSDVDSIDSLASLKSLESLNLYGSHTFKDYAPLAGLPLKRIDVYMNKQATPQNLAVLNGCETLETFEASLTKTVTDISFLAGCRNLQSVSLWNDPITDLTPLADKQHLRELDLNGTKVTDLTPLAGCTELKEIKLSQTPVTNIAPLLGLKKLTQVKLPAGVPAEQVEQLKSANPTARVVVDKAKS